MRDCKAARPLATGLGPDARDRIGRPMRLRRILRVALAPLAFLACQQPHEHDPSCESGLVAATQSTTAPPAGAQEQATETRAGDLTAAEALAAFDEAWQTIHDTHFDPSFNGVDWDALKTELRPRAERARTDAELREVLDDMLGRLGQSHFAVIPSSALPEQAAGAHDQSGGLGFDVRLREGRLLVVALEAGGAA